MGSSLLTGLMVCGHCGRKLMPKYSGRDGKSLRYICRGAAATTGQTDKCFSTNARKLEQAVVQEVLKIIQPAVVDATIAAEQKRSSESSAWEPAVLNLIQGANSVAEGLFEIFFANKIVTFEFMAAQPVSSLHFQKPLYLR